MNLIRRAAPVLVTLGLLAPTSLFLVSSSASVPSASAAVRQSGKTVVLPQIVQPGGKPATAAAARVAGQIKFRPARKGRTVVIQKRLGTGAWRKHTVTRQNKAGVVRFNGPASKRKKPYSYRGVAVKYGDLGRFAPRPQSTKVWEQKFLDQFGGTALGSQWQDRVTTADSRQCSEVGDPAMSKVAKGTLRLSVKPNPDKPGPCTFTDKDGVEHTVSRHYLNGQVSTQHMPDTGAFTRGVFAARIKFQQKRGQHGSFWLQPVSPQYLEGQPKASGAEIDIVEFFGQGYPKGGLASFLYNYGIDAGETKIGDLAPKATKMLPGTDNWWKSYHVFSLEWTKNAYVFRVDGREHFRTKRGVSGIDEYMILSLLSSDWELLQAKKQGIKPGGTTHVDWVRVWEKKK
jgi:hypothetical protein